MVGFFNKIELSDNKYQTNRAARGERYKGKFLFPMKDFVWFGTYRQSIYFMSTRFWRDNIDGVRVS